MTDPRSIDGVHIWTPKRTMDQGSVQVVGNLKRCLMYFTTRSCPNKLERGRDNPKTNLYKSNIMLDYPIVK